MAKQKAKSFHGEMCTHVSKITAYENCSRLEMAKLHAIALQKLLIDRGLLIDPVRGACDNGHQIGKT